jgi:hypothetical protein
MFWSQRRCPIPLPACCSGFGAIVSASAALLKGKAMSSANLIPLIKTWIYRAKTPAQHIEITMFLHRNIAGTNFHNQKMRLAR